VVLKSRGESTVAYLSSKPRVHRVLTLERLAIGLAVLATGIAEAQNPIQWVANGRQGIAMAKERELPLFFYVSGGRDGGRSNDLKRAQQATFRDPLVVSIAQKRFIPVRVARTSANRPIMEELGLPTTHGWYAALITPSGEMLEQIGAQQLADPAQVAETLARAFGTFRDQFFQAKLKPVFSRESLTPRDLTRTLKRVHSMVILSADETVAAQLDRPNLSNPVRKQIYDTLALLSTQTSVDTLMAAAPQDRLAATALRACRPGAADYLLPYLSNEDTQVIALAYGALAHINKLSRPRPASFWSSDHADLKNQEIARVTERAQAAAARWNKTVGRFR